MKSKNLNCYKVNYLQNSAKRGKILLSQSQYQQGGNHYG